MQRRGFTLIELLVVVAIIALLAAILFPIFAHVKERGKQIKCLSNLRQLSMGFLMYADDNGGGMPSLSRHVNTYFPLPGNPNPGPDWCGSFNTQVGCLVFPEKGTLYPYVKTKQVYLCPADYGVRADNVLSKPKNYAISYNVNYQLMFAKLDSLTAGRSAKILMMMQESRTTINDGYFVWKDRIDSVSNTHWDGTTTSYCDGHAKWRSFKDLDRDIVRNTWELFP
ncbi:MAG: prepilin-type N-terminal cleavage/methylation domain-containing protein [Armatimonadota bacterium]|nr:prepilin-type N-terminal cleavage/methylation domain-containing protein [Armatimonadota bacterium]